MRAWRSWPSAFIRLGGHPFQHHLSHLGVVMVSFACQTMFGAKAEDLVRASAGAEAIGSGLADVLRGRGRAGFWQAVISFLLREIGGSRRWLEEKRSCDDYSRN